MVASSEQHSAPVIVSNPAIAHARSSQPGAPLSLDDSADVIKIPEPIIEPITIIVASIGPSVRTRPDCWRLSTLSLTTNSGALRFSRLRVRVVSAIHARIQLLPAYRYEHKSFRRALRRLGPRPSALCLRVTSAVHAAPLHSDRGATHPVASVEPAIRHSNNCDRRRFHARLAISPFALLAPLRYSRAQTESARNRLPGLRVQWLPPFLGRAPPCYTARHAASHVSLAFLLQAQENRRPRSDKPAA